MSTKDASAVTASTEANEDAQVWSVRILGMSCASCANRIERALNALEGTEASINFATEKAHIRTALGRERVEEAIRDLGYTVYGWSSVSGATVKHGGSGAVVGVEASGGVDSGTNVSAGSSGAVAGAPVGADTNANVSTSTDTSADASASSGNSGAVAGVPAGAGSGRSAEARGTGENTAPETFCATVETEQAAPASASENPKTLHLASASPAANTLPSARNTAENLSPRALKPTENANLRNASRLHARTPNTSPTEPPLPASAPIEESVPPEESVAPRSANLRARLLFVVACAVPVVVLSMVSQLQFAGWQWVVWVLATPVALWGAAPFHKGALRAARHANFTMDTLVSLSVIAAYAWSVWALFFGGAGQIGLHHIFQVFSFGAHTNTYLYFETACAITLFILLGRSWEDRAKARARSLISELAKLTVKQARVLRQESLVQASGDALSLSAPREQFVPIEQLRVGDICLVKAGEQIPCDGVIVEGAGEVDTSALTGESLLRTLGRGDEVFQTSVNASGFLKVRVTRTGEQTQIAQIARYVEQAQVQKARAQRLADRISSVFVPTVIVCAVLTFVLWMLFRAEVVHAFSAAVAVLIIACPCALGLATPIALLVGSGRAAQLGILIRGIEALERAGKIDTIAFDKTGTLTEGTLRVQKLVIAEGENPELVRSRARALELRSEHTIAQAVVNYLTPESARAATPAETVTEFHTFPGLGASAHIAGELALIGSAQFMHERGCAIPDSLQAAAEHEESQGRTLIFLAWDSLARAAFSLSDSVKPSSAPAIAQLHALSLRTLMLTGDSAAAAHHIAQQVGISEVHSQLLPTEKVSQLTALRAEGRTVAMVGDGVNDAAALTSASLGIAMGSGTDLATAAADIIAINTSVTTIPTAIRLCRKTSRIIRTNLFWAFSYNTAMIPLAALGVLNPTLAGAAMAFSSVFVVANSLRLRRFKS